MHDNMNMMNRPDNHEAKMARADLFKCAQYSFKLFKMIQEDQELEGWVQAKITKAADYIASVYHYMEYEMKISEYGDSIENADMYSESIRRAFAQKLTEAKVQAKKAKDEMEKKEKALDEEKSSTGGEITRSKGVTKHKHNPDRFSDEPHAEPASKAKSKSAAEKASDKAYDKAQEKDSKAWGKANPGKQTIMKGGVKTTNEGVFGNDEASLAKKSPQLQQLIALRKDPKYQSPQGKAALEARIKKQMDRVSLDKGEVVGSDGKPVAVKEGKPTPANTALKGLSGAAALYFGGKAVKTAAEIAKAKENAKKDPAAPSDPNAAVDPNAPVTSNPVREGKKPDFLDMDKDGNKKEPMKKAVADKKKNPFTKVKEQTVSSMNAPHQQDRARKADLDQRAQALSKTDRNFRNEFTKLLDQRGKDSAGPGGTMLAFDRFYSGLEKLLSQYQVKEATAKCNHTAKGKSCPVHGLKECGSMMEGYYDLNDDGMQPIDLSSRPSFKEILARYTQLVYQSHEGETSNEEDQEYNDIEQYVAKRFGEKGSAHLQKAGETSFYGRDDGRGQGGSRSSNLGRPSQPGGDFRTTKAGKMHGQDAKMMKSKVAGRLGRHPEPNLPEQDMYEGDKFDPLKHVKNPTKGEKTAAKDVKRGSYADRAAMLKSAEKDGRLKG